MGGPGVGARQQHHACWVGPPPPRRLLLRLARPGTTRVAPTFPARHRGSPRGFRRVCALPPGGQAVPVRQELLPPEGARPRHRARPHHRLDQVADLDGSDERESDALVGGGRLDPPARAHQGVESSAGDVRQTALNQGGLLEPALDGRPLVDPPVLRQHRVQRELQRDWAYQFVARRLDGEPKTLVLALGGGLLHDLVQGLPLSSPGVHVPHDENDLFLKR
mmetsp:Transcript_4033/g.9586  ORF Transcript_4033/g.9586 Transcript_4033/m.9586 type:complete len:221 (-) Transcript_4033:35-697(-)